jgi:ATP-dependent helicase/nuclease subunit A
VILSGLTSQGRQGRGVQLLWPAAGGYAVRFNKMIQTDDFDAAAPVDEQMDDLEKRRLLYVAATRARDHLVVSLHRPAQGASRTAAQLLVEAGAAGTAGAVLFQRRPSAEMPGPPRSPVVASAPAYAAWLADITEARERSRRPGAQSASGLEGTEPEVVLARAEQPGLAKGPRDLELPPWSKGRYGSAIGRAVHAVLQAIPLNSPDPLVSATVSAAAAAQCVAEGLVGHEDLVRSLVASALGSAVVRHAASREHWRETYVATVEENQVVLEGYIDLVYRDDDGSLVIVDYKTDAVPAGAIPSRVAYYRPQMEAYLRCLRAATGARLSAELLFLHPTVEATAVRIT